MLEDKVSILHSDIDFEPYQLKNFVNLSEHELDMVRTWRNHPDVRKWMFSQHEISQEEHRAFVENLKNSYKDAYWMVIRESVYIGVVYLNRINFKHKHAYLGIYANPLNKVPEAGRILIDLVTRLSFDLLNLHTLKLEVMEDNHRAIKLYARAKFKEEGRLKEFVYRNGKWIDVVVMGIINGGPHNELNGNC